MPPNTATLRVGPYLLSLLVVLIALFALVFLPGQRHTPKLGLDLEGGATVTLKAQTPNGKTPSQSAMGVARQILEKRVNAKGVSAAQVFQQGSNEIVISVPGANSHDVAKIAQAAKLNFRPLIMAGVPNTATTTTATPTSGTASSGATAKSSGSTTPTGGTTTSTPQTTVPKTSATTPRSTTSPNGLLAAPTTTPASKAAKATAAKTTAAKTPAAATTTAAATLSGDPFTSLGFPLPTTDTAFNALTSAQQAALTAALGRFDCKVKPTDVPSADLAACDDSNPPGYKYLLGPVIVAGTQISSADAVAPDGTNTQTWTVSINLKSTGQTNWARFTGAHHSSAQSAGASACSPSTLPCADFVAFTLDGAVIGAPPQTQSTINGTTQVSGNFTEGTAKDLANDLKYGALPLNFRQLQAQDISATLGSSQLKAGLLAGGIGLLLVVIYSFLYYRGLGFVTVFSLVVSGALTYACLVILGRAIGFTLTLAGIAGFIVAVGITADSFVVLFERLKDEVHSGRSIRVAVPRAWTRARRTILSADTVSFLAALILYYFTVGDVRGFAFTLGLSTLLDLVVVFLFTHPLVSLLSRSRAFGSPRFTGLNSVRSGGIAPSPEGHVRPVGSKSASSGKRRTPAGSVALLEREADTDFGDDDVVTDEPVSAPVASAPAEPELNSGAPRRSRVVPRSAPAAEIGADAAERAAARRGRTVRPPRPKVEASVEDDLDADDLDDELADDAAGNPGDGVDGDDVDGDDSPELSDTAVEVPPIAPAKAPIKSAPVKAAPPKSVPAKSAPAPATRAEASATGSTAAERAAARRRRPPADAPEPVATTPAQPAPAAPEPATPEPATPISTHEPEALPAVAEPIADDLGTENVSPVGSVAETAPEPEIEPETTEPIAEAASAARETAAGDAPSRPTTAGERAAARRARIRTRAGSALDTDGEGES